MSVGRFRMLRLVILLLLLDTGLEPCAAAQSLQTGEASILCLGQSIASNMAPTLYRCQGKVLSINIETGEIATASDPLPNAQGNGGSAWTRMADELVRSRTVASVYLISIAQYSVPLSAYLSGGTLYNKLVRSFQVAREKGHPVTQVVIHHGSADVGASTETYLAGLNALRSEISDLGETPDFLECIHSGTGDYEDNGSPINKSRTLIRQAQLAFIDDKSVFRGPDTDFEVRNEMRVADHLHFNDFGYSWFSKLLADSFRAYFKAKANNP